MLLHAQHNMWLWKKGDSTYNAISVYGVQGVFAQGNNPSARFEPAVWTAKDNKLWMFGGGIAIGAFVQEGYSDLWCYDPAINQWAWMGGDQTLDEWGTHGTKGVAAPGNRPGSKLAGVATWVDANGDLWLFGGVRAKPYGATNELWRYNIATGMWTWMSGDSLLNQNGVYGTKGVAALTNIPGSRGKTTATWVTGNRLWLFGGLGYDSQGSFGEMNDLWYYDISTNQWTWVSGSDVANEKGAYGTKGVPSVNNIPGARYPSATWQDHNDNFWIFGGRGYDKDSSYANLNDLWKYDPVANTWTWMHGMDTVGHTGTYGNQCTPAAANMPCARMGSHSNYVDSCGNFWLFGGLHEGQFGVPAHGTYSDLWRYRVSTNEWMWVAGQNSSNLPGHYGTKGVPTSVGYPATRTGHVTWATDSGMYMFGGIISGNKRFNDVWHFLPDKPNADFVTPADDCEGNIFQFQNTTTISCDDIRFYNWTFGDPFTANDTSDQVNPSHTYDSAGVYNTTLIATSCSYTKDTIEYPVVAVEIPTMTISADTGICPGETVVLNAASPVVGVTYQWSNGINADSASVQPLLTAMYTATVLNAMCSVSDSVEVEVFDLPAGTLDDEYLVKRGESLQLINNSVNSTCFWSPPEGLSCADCCDPVVTTNEELMYVVMMTDSNGCVGYDTTLVSVESICNDLFIPNVFSPNGDAQNDVFEIYGGCLQSATWMIFDRWGAVVFETNDITQSWDGTGKNGQALNTGVLTYLLKGVNEDGTDVNLYGTVNLIR